jgi:hypothetical protein
MFPWMLTCSVSFDLSMEIFILTPAFNKGLDAMSLVNKEKCIYYHFNTTGRYIIGIRIYVNKSMVLQ